MRRAPIVVIILAITMLGACGTESAKKAAPESKKPGAIPVDYRGDGVWNELVAKLPADGKPTPELALSAWSLYFPAPPGVSALKADDSVPALADVAIEWALDVYPQLTIEQQRAIDAVLDAPPSGGPGKAVRATGVNPGAVQGNIDRAQRELERKLNHQLQTPISWRITETVLTEDAAAYASTSTEVSERRNGTRDALCTITLLRPAASLSGIELYAALAHEVYHCFQNEMYPDSAREQPLWFREGSAAWVGEVLAGGTPLSRAWWHNYLVGSTNSKYWLRNASYSAIGLYGLLDDDGVDVWSRIASTLNRRITSSDGIWAELTGGSNALARWAPSVAREATWGPEWQANGPGITGDARPATELVPAPTDSTSVGPLGNVLVKVPMTGDLLRFEATGFGLMRHGDSGPQRAIDGVYATTWCVDGSCVCPDGNPPPGITFERPPSRDPVTVAVAAGTADDATVTATALRLEDLCRPPRGNAWVDGPHPMRVDGPVKCVRWGDRIAVSGGVSGAANFFSLLAPDSDTSVGQSELGWTDASNQIFGAYTNPPTLQVTLASDRRSGTFSGTGVNPAVIPEDRFSINGGFTCTEGPN